jgi:hypothetical protein
VAQEGGPNCLEKRGMPELQELEDRGDDENGAAHEPGRELWPYGESEEAPEDHVEEAARVSVHPDFSGACVELGGEADRHDDCKNEEKAKPHGDMTPALFGRHRVGPGCCQPQAPLRTVRESFPSYGSSLIKGQFPN